MNIKQIEWLIWNSEVQCAETNLERDKKKDLPVPNKSSESYKCRHKRDGCWDKPNYTKNVHHWLLEVVDVSLEDD